MKQEKFKPGEIAPRSGQYAIVGPRGGNTGIERTITKGEPFPPTPGEGFYFILVDATKHKTNK